MSYHANDPRNFSSSDGQSSARAKRLTTKKKLFSAIFTTFVILLLALAILIFSEVGMGIAGLIKDNAKDDPKGDPPAEEPDNPDDPKPPQNSMNLINKTYESEKDKLGELVLINSTHQYPELEEVKTALTDIYAYRKAHLPESGYSNYQLATSTLMLNHTALEAFHTMMGDFFAVSQNNQVQIYAAFRTHEEQEGKTIPAGYSDTHSGYIVALRAPRATGGFKYLTSTDPEFSWLYENAHKYGYVVRYPAEKLAHHGVDDCEEFFRYVGTTHASIMYEKDMCLEEYVTYLKDFSAEGEHLKATVGGTNYELYYVPASSSEITVLPVPADYEYSISGTNDGGFVVAVKMS